MNMTTKLINVEVKAFRERYITPRFIIASTGHSGSGYISRVLRNYGIKCGHEAYYRFPWKLPKGNYEGDSSWHVVAELKDYDGIVFHQVRNPLHVVNSLYKTFKISNSKRWKWRSRFIPSPTGDRLRDIMGMVASMNTTIANYSDYRYRVEDVDKEIIRNICKLLHKQHDELKAAKALYEVSTNYNSHHNTSIYPGWDELPDSPQKEMVMQQAKEYNYL